MSFRAAGMRRGIPHAHTASHSRPQCPPRHPRLPHTLGTARTPPQSAIPIPQSHLTLTQRVIPSRGDAARNPSRAHSITQSPHRPPRHPRPPHTSGTAGTPPQSATPIPQSHLTLSQRVIPSRGDAARNPSRAHSITHSPQCPPRHPRLPHTSATAGTPPQSAMRNRFSYSRLRFLVRCDRSPL
jgi:hypothetical protein